MEIFIVIYLLFILFMATLFAKNNRTSQTRSLIIKAIHDYNVCQILNDPLEDLIDYDVMEGYDKTLWRLWDWGYENIVPSDVLKEIEPFIGREETTQ